MKVGIVFESMFGNTEKMAGEVAEGLSDAGADVTLMEVIHAVAGDARGCDLLVVAAPTHALSLSRPQTRADAVARGASPAEATTGVREWLGSIDDLDWTESTRPRVAVFDTKVEKARHWPGSAARRIARTMTKAGFAVVARTSFYVEDVKGPIVAGEPERARLWGRHLAEILQNTDAASP